MGWLLQQRCYNLVIASCAQSALRFYLCTALETEISHEEVFADVCMAVPSKISFAAAPPETPKHKSLGGHSNGVTRLPFWSSINCKQSLKIHFFSLFPNIINVHTADTALGDDTEIAISLCTWTAPHLLLLPGGDTNCPSLAEQSLEPRVSPRHSGVPLLGSITHPPHGPCTGRISSTAPRGAGDAVAALLLLPKLP